MSIAAASLASANGIKTSVATALTAQSYTTAALNGALVFSNVAEPRLGGFLELASWPTVTASNTVGAFVAGSAIVFTGTYAGEAITRTALLTSANGNETVFADGPMDTVTSIAVAAQADTDGTFTFGFSGVCPRKKIGPGGHLRKWALVGGGAGNIVVGYPSGNDTLVSTAGQQHPAAVSRIFATTAVAVTIYEYD